jgi:Holliday junction DNA helicase RuvA
MIGSLRGVVSGMRDQAIILDVHGVGYLVEVSGRLLNSAPQIGEPITLSIETYVREDQFRLFGFSSEEDRQWFRLLMGVQGVGAKVALAILGLLSAADLADAIALQDKAIISRTPGVGPKVAQRIVQELAGKAPEPEFRVAGDGAEDIATNVSSMQDALAALINLGYVRAHANGVLQKIRNQEDAPSDTQGLIKLALRELSK